MKRLQPIILFMTIAVLLTAKAALSVWHSSTDNAQGNISSQAPSTQTMIPPQRKLRPQTITPASPEDSWAMLEAYLIPEAGAASAPQSSALPIEDKTLASLRQYKEELDQRAKQLDQRTQSLQQAEEKLKQRITELEQLEASIKQRLDDESKVKNKKIKRLTAVYEGMKPDRAAPVIAKMELATVVKIFLLMDEKKVGKILSYLPPGKAVSISQALTSQISSVK